MLSTIHGILVTLCIVLACASVRAQRLKRRSLDPSCSLQLADDTLPSRNHDDIVAAAVKWAPMVNLADGEEWRPSSVDFFLNAVNLRGGTPTDVTSATLPVCNDDCYLETKVGLSCASCTDPPVFHGQDPAVAPVYVIYEETNSAVTITYWFFYPYNRGKRVCIGYYMDVCCGEVWGRCLCGRIRTCIGGYSTFGHHVGDWERVVITFKYDKLYSIYLYIHGSEATSQFGGEFVWDGQSFKQGSRTVSLTECSHPVIYSAKGSHGSWPEPGEHVYKDIIMDKLVDSCSDGQDWQTWNNLKVVKNTGSPFTGEFSFLNFKGRWGNRESECTLRAIGIDQCILSNGPTGPLKK